MTPEILVLKKYQIGNILPGEITKNVNLTKKRFLLSFNRLTGGVRVKHDGIYRREPWEINQTDHLKLKDLEGFDGSLIEIATALTPFMGDILFLFPLPVSS